jgi:hypothetical protein
MNGRIIRYKRPEWTTWNTIKVKEEEVEAKVAALRELGYQVEY